MCRSKVGVSTTCQVRDTECLDGMTLPPRLREKRAPRDTLDGGSIESRTEHEGPFMLRVKELVENCDRDSEGCTVLVRLNQPGYTTAP